MKILYGVQGTGNGHIARARVMAKAFAERNDVEVDFLFSGREADQYFDMQVFGDYQTRRGFTFITAKGAVDRWQTWQQAKISQFFRDVKALDLSGYDLLLNDFEPITAWAARRQKLPSMAISHQAAFSYPVPKRGNSFIDDLITKHFAPADIALGVHWYHFGHNIMPPFIEERLEQTPTHAHILVYLPFEELDAISDLLEPLSEYNFECFHPKLSEDRQQGHIYWRKTSKPLFKKALLDCSGVVANAGFELSSEALQLGKKLLLKPLNGQFEQLSNVQTLTELGLCNSMFTLETDAVEQWLALPEAEPVHFPDNPQLFIDWLLKKDWHNTQAICNALWQQVRFPDAVKQRLQGLNSKG